VAVNVQNQEVCGPAHQIAPGRRPYRRVLLKLGGEYLVGDARYGIDPRAAQRLAELLAQAIHDTGVELAIVIGGGNLWRGDTGHQLGMEEAQSHYIGMLGTCMNALALQEALERVGIVTRVQTAIEMRQVAEPYIRRRAIDHLEDGKVVIFGAGTGNPFFTTDTAAALRGAEIGAEIVLKATKVDGVYTADPKKDSSATRYSKITFDEAMSKNLGIMDATAFALCRDQKLPVKVFSIFKHGALKRVVMGEDEGTLVYA